MINIVNYNASQLNMGKIINYAKLVANHLSEQMFEVTENKQRTVSYGFLNLKKRTETFQETTWKKSEFWILKSDNFIYEESDSDCDITEVENSYKCLRSNGELFNKIITWREILRKPTYKYFEDSHEEIEYLLSEEQILDFDYSDRYYEGTKGKGKFHRNGLHGDLLFEKKGDGLLLKLEQFNRGY